MGFHRTAQRSALDRDALRTLLAPVVEDELAFIARTIDPFNVDNDCTNQAGHFPVRDHTQIVCVHCSKVIWS